MIKKLSAGLAAIVISLVILTAYVYNSFRTMDVDFDFEDIK